MATGMLNGVESRTVSNTQTSLVKSLDHEFGKKTAIAALLYLLFWLPGLVMNVIFLKSATDEEKKTRTEMRSTGWLWALLGLGISIPVVAVTVYMLAASPASSHRASDPAHAVQSSEEEKDYVEKVILSDVHFSKTAFATLSLIGKLSNNGGKALRQVEINVQGLGEYGEVVFDRKYYPISYSAWKNNLDHPLGACSYQTFSIPIERIPSDWGEKLKVKVIAVKFLK